MSFIDSPSVKDLQDALLTWQKSGVPRERGDIYERLLGFADNLELPAGFGRSRYDAVMLDWLYDFIRANIKRGPVFDLRETLHRHQADCLAYSKLFTLLGRKLGLDVGVVDVLIDSGGRFVPHTAILVNIKNRRARFIDLWYGSRDIKHKRLGLRVHEGGGWVVKDINFTEIAGQAINYLPDTCVDAITLYVIGNRYLGSGEFAEAIESYTHAIQLYPQNRRAFYNRAIAYEQTGESEKAMADYTQAMMDESAIIRLRASEYDEITALSQLDIKAVADKAQEIYLLHRGIVTGRPVPVTGIARRYAMPEDEVAGTIAAVEQKLTG